MTQPKVQAEQLGGVLPLTGGELSGNLKLHSSTENTTAVSISSGTITLDVATANVFTLTRNAAITSVVFSNVPSAGTACSIVLKMESGGTFSVTWPVSVKWPGGTAPTLTDTVGQTDTVVLYTDDGGTSWLGFTAGLDL